MPPRIKHTCESCGAAALTNGVKTLIDGTRKRRVRCFECGYRWSYVISGPRPPVERKTSARFNGLWMFWRGYWYSPAEQARIREVYDGVAQ